MSKLLLGFAALAAAVIPARPAAAQSTAAQNPTDWDLYMLRLVNGARVDPSGEDVRQGTSYGETAVAPLAYDPLVGRAAQNHDEWMGLNRNNPAIDNPSLPPYVPDSFTHYETLDGQLGGTPATGTPGYSGARTSNRLEYVGFDWWSAGENILWGSATPPIDAAQIEANHAGWWTSDGHRENIMYGAFALFGHHCHNDDDHWATQAFASQNPYTGEPDNVFGLLYRDRDDSGGWTPRDAGDPLREGLGAIAFDVLPHGGGAAVASGVTLENGSYAVGLADGTYDLLFTDASLPGGAASIDAVVVSGENVDAGDLLVALPPGDVDGDGKVDAADAALLNAAWGAQSGDAHYNADADFNGDGRIDIFDAFVMNQNWDGPGSGAATPPSVPEPTTACLLLTGALAVLRRAHRGRRRRTPAGAHVSGTSGEQRP